jgi:hypothetical protein
MPAVTDNRLKGNYGTALVMSRLSGECLVRHASVRPSGMMYQIARGIITRWKGRHYYEHQQLT